MAVTIVLISSCNKNDPYELVTPGEFVHFLGAKSQSYILNVNPAPKYQLTVGTTDVSTASRTVTYKLTSPTNAVQGTHYTISPATLTIPAGQATATIDIQGIYSEYATGRKDTLIFTLVNPSINPATFSDTIRLAIKGPCLDGDLVATPPFTLIGTYPNTNDNGIFGASGPYAASVVSVTPLTAITARAVINNVWDFGFGNINFILDWTNPLNTFTKVESPTVTTANAGVFNPAYNGFQIVVRDHPSPGTASNKFSVCTGKLFLRYQFGVYNPATSTILGYFGSVETTVLSQ